jgi:hypothetical protein
MLKWSGDILRTRVVRWRDQMMAISADLKLTRCSTALLEKLTGPQLVKNFPASYDSRKFITTFTSARHLTLSCAKWIQLMPSSHFLNIRFNIFLPSTLRSSNRSRTTVSPPKANMLLSSYLNMYLAYLISVLLIWSLEKYLFSSSYRKVPRYVVFSSVPLLHISWAHIWSVWWNPFVSLSIFIVLNIPYFPNFNLNVLCVPIRQ